MYPIVGTIGYILPLCGEGKTTAKKKNLEKRKNKRKTQQKLKKRKNTAKKILIFMSIHVDCKTMRLIE